MNRLSVAPRRRHLEVVAPVTTTFPTGFAFVPCAVCGTRVDLADIQNASGPALCERDRFVGAQAAAI